MNRNLLRVKRNARFYNCRQNIRRKEIIADGKTVTKEKAGSQLLAN